jgi:hypothetical protein
VTDNGFQKRTMVLAGVDVAVQSYRVGARWAAKVETTDVGNSLGRAQGDTRETAEAGAMDAATVVLELRHASAAFKNSAQRAKL